MEGESKGSVGQTVWTSSQSTFVQTFLANLVADGIKTSTGFKKVHLNACAKALNDHFKLNRNANQIANHLKGLKRKYVRINYLRSKTGAGWDEENFIVSYDHEQYTNHFKDDQNKGDDEFINKPLPYYGTFATIFGNSGATGQFVKTSSEPLCVDKDIEEPTQKEDEDFVAASSAIHDKEDTAGSASRPFKKVKRDDRSVDPLVQAVENGSQTLANAINNVAASKIAPPDLFAALDSLPGFEMEQKSKYYSYMLEHPNIAHGFMNVPLLYKISMLTDFINKNM